jgi:hypothetical protein
MTTMRTRLAGLAIAGLSALAAASFAGAASGGGHVPSGPPNNVWTCGYIATHPAEAAAALVSCDASGPVTVPGVVATPTPFSALSSCARIPASGNISQGVFAWSSYLYFNYFSYSPAVVQLFTWYVQKQDGTNVQWGQDTQTNDHAVTVGANNYRWGAQNNAASVQHWTFCWAIN